jgi:hypothetical protein
MGMYADPKLLNWFTTEFPKHSKSKLDMGKSCIRFKNIADLDLDGLKKVILLGLLFIKIIKNKINVKKSKT